MTQAHRTAVWLGAWITAAVAAVAAAGEAAAQTTTLAPYYNGSSPPPTNSTWMDGMGQASLPNIIDLLLRVGSVVVGGGGSIAGGGGPTGPILFGFMLLGGGVSAVIGSGMGSVAAGVLLVAVAAGVVAFGFVPQWLFAVLLFGVGVLAYRAFASIIQ
ncbi:hypothetical protein [Halobaculum sp. D14]|uniref:hypothetical protein n=1 Tax=Halobaculum sp. D14 TaxID=3421642 RepID=UPI003EBF5A5A